MGPDGDKALLDGSAFVQHRIGGRPDEDGEQLPVAQPVGGAVPLDELAAKSLAAGPCPAVPVAVMSGRPCVPPRQHRSAAEIAVYLT